MCVGGGGGGRCGGFDNFGVVARTRPWENFWSITMKFPGHKVNSYL